MRTLLLTLLLFLGITAVISGTLLAVQPDGRAFKAPLSLLERTPFTDFFWPGVILGGLLGAGAFLTSLAIRRGWPWCWRMAQVIGAGLVIWILAQAWWFPVTSFLQWLYGLLGLAIIGAAERCRRDFRLRNDSRDPQ